MNTMVRTNLNLRYGSFSFSVGLLLLLTPPGRDNVHAVAPAQLLKSRRSHERAEIGGRASPWDQFSNLPTFGHRPQQGTAPSSVTSRAPAFPPTYAEPSSACWLHCRMQQNRARLADGGRIFATEDGQRAS
jgi:hypothetical protein